MPTPQARKTAPNALERIVAAKLAARNVKVANNLQDLPLWEFLLKASPEIGGHPTLAPVHLDPLLPWFDKIEKEPTVFCFSAPPRHGKDFSDDTVIVTRRGRILAKDVIVGDEVYGSDGNFTRVLEIFPQSPKEQFRVSFSDGASVIAGAGHQWHVRQRYYDKWHTKTTEEIAKDLHEADGRKKWRVPVTAPVKGIKHALPIDPYVLGLWLGDGTTLQGSITTMDPEIREALHSLYPITHIATKPDNRASTYRSPSLHAKLREHGFIGNKHVPDVYLTASASDRLSILQGLNDTDGTVAGNGSQQSFCSTLPVLRDAVCELVSSLGGTYTIVEKPTYRKTAYNVYFRLPPGMEGFRLERKQSKLAKASPRNIPRRFIDSIEPVGVMPSRCFMVEAEDHLFCIGRDYVVTHNSIATNHLVARHMLRHPGVKIAYGSYSLDLSADFFSGEVKKIFTNNDIPLNRNANTKEYWELENGSSFKAIAPGSGFTGRGADLIIIDDPYKNRDTASSGEIRKTVWDWVTDVCFTRRSPNASIIVTHTRWVFDDVIGVLSRDYNFPYVNMPAINEHGEALWPAQWNTERLLKEIRPIEGEHKWASLYMGSPQPLGGAVFKGIKLYTE